MIFLSFLSFTLLTVKYPKNLRYMNFSVLTMGQGTESHFGAVLDSGGNFQRCEETTCLVEFCVYFSC